MTTEETTATRQHKNPLELTHTDVEALTRFVTDTGKILPRRITGLTALQQRHITRTIKRARNLLLMK
ncbi:MAG: 30S ribosomal protein S18 [Opitutales bacterium]|nr:30S ribosomal protein S18 [Opitutales bacterium]